MKVERMPRSGTTSRQRAMRSRVFSWFAGRRMALSTVGRGVLKRDVEIGQDLALGHQRQHLVDMRIGVDIVQPDPGAEATECRAQIVEPRLERLAAPVARREFQVDAVSAGILADDEKLTDAARNELLGLLHHIGGGAARQHAPQLRDDAEEHLLLQPSEIFT